MECEIQRGSRMTPGSGAWATIRMAMPFPEMGKVHGSGHCQSAAQIPWDFFDYFWAPLFGFCVLTPLASSTCHSLEACPPAIGILLPLQGSLCLSKEFTYPPCPLSHWPTGTGVWKPSSLPPKLPVVSYTHCPLEDQAKAFLQGLALKSHPCSASHPLYPASSTPLPVLPGSSSLISHSGTWILVSELAS